MSKTEKVPGKGPIPNAVYHDATESIAPPIKLQVSRLTRFAVSAALAEALAPFAYGAQS